MIEPPIYMKILWENLTLSQNIFNSIKPLNILEYLEDLTEKQNSKYVSCIKN